MKRNRIGWLWLAALVSVGGYLLASQAVNGIGFPLDDAWIHQTYARNLGERGEWSFTPGVISAGSTAPLWSGLLAIGHFLRIGPYVWTYVLGFAALVGLAWAGELIWRRQTGYQEKWPWMGVFLALEWHLVWAAASGMETVLFAALSLMVFYWLARAEPRWFLAGLAVGVAVWVRPDGITLLGPLGLLSLVAIGQKMRGHKNGERKNLLNLLRPIALAGLGFLVAFLPYVLFNLAIAGRVWPNTLYAKQAEYASSLQLPIIQRAGELLVLPLVGGGALLLPGVLYAVWRAVTRHNWAVLALFLWWLGYNVIYLFSLPLTYQHGRYLIPSMPAFFLLGGIGMAWLWDGRLGLTRTTNMNPLFAKRTRRLLRVAWMGCLVLVTLAFSGLGAVTYAQDVAIIESEMVATAKWLGENIPAGSRVAVHDIGAIGYFSRVEILDTAGLISPEVIPFIRDEARLADFLDEQQVSYLVTFPGWYPELVQRARMVFQTSGRFAPEAGGENMAVYRWGR